MKTLTKIGFAAACMSMAAVTYAQTTSAPLITDASGKKVIGRVVGYDQLMPLVLVGTGNQAVVLRLQTQGSAGLTWQNDQIYYASPGCVGTAYIPARYYGTHRFGVVAGSGTQAKVYYSAADPVFLNLIEWFSVYYNSDNNPQCMTLPSASRYGGTFTTIESSISIGSLGLPPFYLK